MTYQRKDDRIVGKIIIEAKLENVTPLTIGRGEGEASDHEVMRLPDGTPYIPASSIAGVLRQLMVELRLTSNQNYLWGKNGKTVKDPIQSHVRFEDLLPKDTSEADISLRDGVKINHQTATAEDGKKYDYQLVEPGQVFTLQAEITVRESMNLVKVETFVRDLKRVLYSDLFRLGAFTNTGFGKFECTDFHAWHFTFPQHAKEWFKYLDKDIFKVEEMGIPEPQPVTRDGSFKVVAWFSLKSSLMVGSYGIHGNEPDKSHLTSRGRPVLPGKSIRGAIRHRAVRIMKLLGAENATNLIHDLFGMVSEENGNTPVKKKGRLRVEEYFFKEDTVEPMIQDRIRIDRFTGGTMDGALFNSEPVWTKGKRDAVQLTFTILKDAEPVEKKLLLLLLKDLWLEDLAIGGEKNVGRGIFSGQEAEIYNDGGMIAAFQRGVDSDTALTFTTGSAAAINEILENKELTA